MSDNDALLELANAKHPIGRESAETLDKLHASKKTITELQAKLNEPLLDKETIERMVKVDEELIYNRSLFMEKLLHSQTSLTEELELEKVAREKWERSIWDWQELRNDVMNRDEPAIGWTTKEIFENRKEEMDEFRRSHKQIQESIALGRSCLETGEEERVKAWRDIVLGKIEEVERRTVELDPESEFKPDVQDEEDEDSGSDMPPSPAPVGEFEYDYSGV